MPKFTGHRNEAPFNFIYVSTPEEIEARKLMDQGHDIFVDPTISEDTKLRIMEHEKFIEIRDFFLIQHDTQCRCRYRNARQQGQYLEGY